MYKEFFGLRENPFSVTSDPDFLFLSRAHREALAHMEYGIRERKGFLEITGEVGAGKTTLCRSFLNSLDARTRSAFVFNSSLPEVQLLRAIVEDFGLTVTRSTKVAMVKQLNDFLIGEMAHGNNVVLIIDEAQNLKVQTLESIRMLSNLETEKMKLFQILLVGQPELKNKLNLPELRQLKQRISIRYHITALGCDEVAGYINHRLTVAGSRGEIVFTEEAVDAVYRFSGGIPRLINAVCDKALLAAYVLETSTINAAIVDRCIREIEGVRE